MVTKKKASKPAEEVVEEIEAPAVEIKSTNNAKQNGVACEDYAKRMLVGMSPDLPVSMQLKITETGLINQGYEFSEISPIINKLAKEMI